MGEGIDNWKSLREACAEHGVAPLDLPALLKRLRTPKVATLGDVRDRLQEMVDAGAHQGSIDWVLRNQIGWPEGDPAGFEEPGKSLQALRFRMETAVRSLDRLLREADQENRDEIFRLSGKVEGMKVALSYVEEMLR